MAALTAPLLAGAAAYANQNTAASESSTKAAHVEFENAGEHGGPVALPSVPAMTPIDVCGPVPAATTGCYRCRAEGQAAPIWLLTGAGAGRPEPDGVMTRSVCTEPWSGPSPSDMGARRVSVAEPVAARSAASQPPKVEAMYSVYEGVVRWWLRLTDDDGEEHNVALEYKRRSTGQVSTRMVTP